MNTARFHHRIDHHSIVIITFLVVKIVSALAIFTKSLYFGNDGTQQSRTREALINLSSRNFRTGQSEAPGLWAWFSPPPAPPALPRYRQHVSNRRPHKAPYFPQSLTQRLEWRKSRNPSLESANLQLALPMQLFGTQTVCWI